MQNVYALVLASLLSIGAVHASEPLMDPPPTLAAVDVAGVMPGPGLWQVRHGEHVLWLVGSLEPVPKRMQWRSAELDARLAEADAVLGGPGIVSGMGILKAMTVLPSIIGIRKLPDRQTLADVLPPEQYARWSELKARHLGRDRAIERWRPLFAAGKLQHKLLEGAGLASRSPVPEYVVKAGKRRKLPWISGALEVDWDSPRQAVREFKRSELDDLDCFDRTLQRLEGDVALLSDRAAAWAVGDVEALRELHDTDPESACLNVLVGAFLQRESDEMRAQIQAHWLEVAEQTLATHRTTVSVVPISLLLDASPDGALAWLVSRGYLVLGPDDFDDGSGDEEGRVSLRIEDDGDPVQKPGPFDVAPF